MKQKKSNGVIFFISIILISIFILNFLNNTVIGASSVPTKTYIVITIQTNDTLWDIAHEYMNDNYYDLDKYISEVKIMNSIKDTTIYAGERLTLPIVK
ncbi:MAG: hypothetical protein CVV02_14770 [Firmicutes bacterium HGW-Firmicutes-7]|nr:MAG: hypothetical protein CVV02_14770 [Firmicutes bacterium HGW-Firmicutes-7]